MAQHGFGQFGGGASGGQAIDPNDLAMSGNFSASSYGNNFNGSNQATSSNAYSSGSALFGDDELLDGLSSPTDGQGMHSHGQDFSGMSEMNMGYTQPIYGSHHGIDQSTMNGYSNTPDGDPIQSPYVHSFNNSQFRQFNPQSLGTSLQSPISYSASPLTGSDLNAEGADANFLNAKNRARMAQAMQRKGSNSRGPMTAKAAMHGVPIGSQDSAGFASQSIPAPGLHDGKSPSGPWMQSPNTMAASYGSGFSPVQPSLAQLNEVMMKGGSSMPAKLGVAHSNAVSSQEMKRKRRRESHNLVERRRRDNINERIQDLSRLVPSHRLEDEKIRKMLQNGTPLSPSLTGVSSPSQATSGLAGPGARRAAGSTAGSITTGLPIEEKDKGPNKGDILNGAVSWTRDLMWMLHLKLQQQEELMNVISELGGHFPFELTEDEKRMQTELMEAMSKNDTMSYSRTPGSGLRVPNHTDIRGESLNGSRNTTEGISVSPGGDSNGGMVGGGAGGATDFWHEPDDDDGDQGTMNFKEEDEFGMDLTQ
ncbi:GLCD beta [Sodiomyces alkalinus F11]|uniref:GLCD beta n=1 Tax=Sodiomyces alkalinus (strain CBS 110278 / VKM F-3762 / F11) TaxID=1314773 RepID=A0A3N2PRE1_SODAK|nr:GLCD beta [Sodiomyces alkalinus F11]ROT37004.1 GLCD beta [Sodiomyces alkalinus F11]